MMLVAIPDDAELNIIPAVSLACQTSFLFSVSVNDLTKTCSLIVLLDLVEIYLNVVCSNSHSWHFLIIDDTDVNNIGVTHMYGAMVVVTATGCLWMTAILFPVTG